MLPREFKLEFKQLVQILESSTLQTMTAHLSDDVLQVARQLSQEYSVANINSDLRIIQCHFSQSLYVIKRKRFFFQGSCVDTLTYLKSSL